MKLLTIATSMVLVSFSGSASEIYNKDGSKLDLYGRIKAQRQFTENSNQDKTFARLGFRGESNISDKLIGFGQFEYQFNANQTKENPPGIIRLAYAGLKFDGIGSIDYGTNYGIIYDIGSYADNFTEFGGDSYQRAYNFMAGRAIGVLTLRNTTLHDKLKIGLQFQGENANQTWHKANGKGIGASLEYEVVDSLIIGSAYSHANHTSDIKSKGYANGNANAWTLGVKYTPSGYYFAATYAETKNMTPFFDKRLGKGEGFFLDKTKNIEVVAAYMFDSGVRPSLGYLRSQANVNGQEMIDVVKYIQIGASYNLNKNSIVAIGYKINLLSDEMKDYGIAADNHAVASITYQF
ncbi:porin [Klebsiella michiganensis]|uniref:Porin OmpC n=1 Tax=Klebsiella michiganensis TaxID=1134687 RepID=A0A6P1V500_9ENTR|nr:porin [Klebsiella michiganensis]QHS50211.1 porin OmpC [Klebsiella michiganensis]HDX8940861.1 porin [Klebsiella michiganensis]